MGWGRGWKWVRVRVWGYAEAGGVGGACLISRDAAPLRRAQRDRVGGHIRQAPADADREQRHQHKRHARAAGGHAAAAHTANSRAADDDDEATPSGRWCEGCHAPPNPAVAGAGRTALPRSAAKQAAEYRRGAHEDVTDAHQRHAEQHLGMSLCVLGGRGWLGKMRVGEKV